MEKCKINGKVKRRPNGNGSCPECTLKNVPLTGKGFIGSHAMPLDLGEGPQVPVTDEGTRVGDPRDAMIRRETEAVKGRAEGAPLPTASMTDMAGVLRGPTLVRGRSMPTRVVDPDGPWAQLPMDTQTAWTVDPDRSKGGTRTVFDQGALGRERPDSEMVARPQRKRSKASKRAYRSRQTALRKAAERRAGKC